eukprot:s1409_g5.t5
MFADEEQTSSVRRIRPSWSMASSSAWRKQDVEGIAGASCQDVMEEIKARVTGDWHDPHNGGQYSLLNESTLELDLKRDFSTNYCNLRNLYCGTEDGCEPVKHDFKTTEIEVKPSSFAGTDKKACIVSGDVQEVRPMLRATAPNFLGDTVDDTLACINDNCPLDESTLSPSPSCVLGNCTSHLAKCLFSSSCRHGVMCELKCTEPLAKTEDAVHFAGLMESGQLSTIQELCGAALRRVSLDRGWQPRFLFVAMLARDEEQLVYEWTIESLQQTGKTARQMGQWWFGSLRFPFRPVQRVQLVIAEESHRRFPEMEYVLLVEPDMSPVANTFNRAALQQREVVYAIRRSGKESLGWSFWGEPCAMAVCKMCIHMHSILMLVSILLLSQGERLADSAGSLVGNQALSLDAMPLSEALFSLALTAPCVKQGNILLSISTIGFPCHHMFYSLLVKAGGCQPRCSATMATGTSNSASMKAPSIVDPMGLLVCLKISAIPAGQLWRSLAVQETDRPDIIGYDAQPNFKTLSLKVLAVLDPQILMIALSSYGFSSSYIFLLRFSSFFNFLPVVIFEIAESGEELRLVEEDLKDFPGLPRLTYYAGVLRYDLAMAAAEAAEASEEATAATWGWEAVKILQRRAKDAGKSQEEKQQRSAAAYFCGRAYLDVLGQPMKAEKWFKKSIKLEKDFLYAHVALIQMLLAKNRTLFCSDWFARTSTFHGAVDQKTGTKDWQACRAGRSGLQLVGAVPMYLKIHSEGEFCEEADFIEASMNHNMSHYPRLFVGIPFTPHRGRRFITAAWLSAEERAEVQRELMQGLRAISVRANIGVNVGFPTEDEGHVLTQQGFVARTARQAWWSNRRPKPYKDFRDFLRTLRLKRAREIAKQRAALRDANVHTMVIDGSLDPDAVTPELMSEVFYSCYVPTQLKNGNVETSNGEYRFDLSEDFFCSLGERIPHRVLLILARENDDGRLLGGSLCFVKDGCIYGRYWGSAETELDLPFLHFECCYYSAIEHAIAHGYERIEPGNGGGQVYKVQRRRGFEPVPTCSFHFIPDLALREEVAELARAAAEGPPDSWTVPRNSAYAPKPREY